MKPIRFLSPRARGAILLLSVTREARADRASEIAAQALYNEAMALMKAEKAEEACPLLAESQRIDPAMGTLYRLAECQKKTGRFETAWKLYLEAAKVAKKAGRADREQQALEHAAALQARLPRLVSNVALAAAPAPVVIKAPPPRAVQPPKAAPAPSSLGTRAKVVIGGLVTTGTAAALGAAFVGVSFAKAGALADLPMTEQCRRTGHGCSPAVADADAARTRFANAAFWSFLAAGAAGAATLTYSLLSSRASGESKVAVVVGPAAIGLRGSF